MRAFVCTAICLGLLSGMWAVPAVAENLRNLDISGGDYEGHWMMVVSRPTREGVPVGLATIALGHEDDFDGAFGMSMNDGKATPGAVTQDQIEEARNADAKSGEPETETAIIKLNPEQYKRGKAVLDKWLKKTEFIDAVHDVAVNYGWEMVKEVGTLKMPYRTGLGAVNPIVWYSDISLLNRNKTGS